MLNEQFGGAQGGCVVVERNYGLVADDAEYCERGPATVRVDRTPPSGAAEGCEAEEEVRAHSSEDGNTET